MQRFFLCGCPVQLVPPWAVIRCLGRTEVSVSPLPAITGVHSSYSSQRQSTAHVTFMLHGCRSFKKGYGTPPFSGLCETMRVRYWKPGPVWLWPPTTAPRPTHSLSHPSTAPEIPSGLAFHSVQSATLQSRGTKLKSIFASVSVETAVSPSAATVIGRWLPAPVGTRHLIASVCPSTML